MDYEWDETKRQSNLVDHGFDFRDAHGFDWDSAVVEIDHRREYGETRYVAYGPRAERLTVLVFTRRGSAVRIISWRKANSREKKSYARKI